MQREDDRFVDAVIDLGEISEETKGIGLQGPDGVGLQPPGGISNE